MTDVFARSIGFKNRSLINTLKNVNPRRFNLNIPTMSSPPTVTLGAAGGSSVIANHAYVSWKATDGVSLNPVYRYVGDMSQVGSSYPDNNYVRNTAVTTTNSNGDYIVEFDFDGTDFELSEKGLGATYRISVDEGNGYQYVNATPQAAAPSDGNLYLRHVQFATRQTRRIKIEYANGYFGGLNIGPNDTIFPASRPIGLRAIFLGDSFTEGTGATFALSSWAQYCAQLLGWECWASGVGGTGYIATGSTGRVNFAGRVQHDVISYSPDVVVLAGGINDQSYTESQITTAVASLINTIRAGLPNTQIIALSNWCMSSPSTTFTNCRDAIKAAVLPAAMPFIDVIGGSTYDSQGNVLLNVAGSWGTGTGNVGTPASTGNSSYYLSSDTTHPSPAGHSYLGERVATEIARIFS